MRINYSSKSARARRFLYASLSIVIGVTVYYLALDDFKSTPVVVSQRSENIQDRFNTMSEKLDSLRSSDSSDSEEVTDGLINPAEYALQAKDYGGHPAYNAAMHAKVCADYFASRSQHDQDLADANQLQRTGNKEYKNIVAETVFTIRTLEVQCRDVTDKDIKNVATLMREAAAAGDIKAQSFVLLEDFHAADAARFKAKQAGNADNTPPATYMGWLDSATKLAEQGNLEAASLAGLMTGIDRYGQKDVAASAAWLLVSLQTLGQPFNPSYFSFENEPYSTMSEAQKASAIRRAKDVYAACCSELNTKLLTGR